VRLVVLNKKYRRCCIVGLLALVVMAAAPGRTRPALQIQLDLTELSLEELMDIRVTTVARKPEKLSEVSAAVHVVTREDIRRSGATSLPAALRLVPGLQVARIDASKWAISARGFNNRFANKLLVLIDGRSVYSPLFSGVFWEA
jgi:iron complex outermembrane receptor protein